MAPTSAPTPFTRPAAKPITAIAACPSNLGIIIFLGLPKVLLGKVVVSLLNLKDKETHPYYRLDGKVRQKRRYRPYKNSVLPTIEDKLLFIWVYLKQNSLQEAQATLFGLHQPDDNRWIH